MRAVRSACSCMPQSGASTEAEAQQILIFLHLKTEPEIWGSAGLPGLVPMAWRPHGVALQAVESFS